MNSLLLILQSAWFVNFHLMLKLNILSAKTKGMKLPTQVSLLMPLHFNLHLWFNIHELVLSEAFYFTCDLISQDNIIQGPTRMNK